MPAKKKKAVKKVIKKVAKKPAKKVTKKVAAKPVKKPALKKIEATKKMMTKSEIQKVIADHAGITKKQVSRVFDVLTKIIDAHLSKAACGSIKIEGLMKIDRIHRPAKKARKGVNPFTGEEMMFKAKPAHSIIKVRALKKLKEMV
jgi:nucleoid DNA-binding protein